ncbi:MAG: hypothetical protein HC822_05785 [Oscillochloris sp.]|nr:hypothetical protein [Oscillochloris sp.]
MNRVTPAQLPAHTALRALPELHAMVAEDLAYQTTLAAPYLAGWRERTALVAQLEAAIEAAPGGLICLAGPPGSGVTSTLLALAAAGSRPIWLEAQRAPLGVAAFCAQIVAVRPQLLPLIDPAVITDAAALERFLAAAVKGAADRLVLLIDLESALLPPVGPLAPPLPQVIPPEVTLVIGCEPKAQLPFAPVARFLLPEADPEQRLLIEQLAATIDPAPLARDALVDAAEGVPLYPLLAGALMRAGCLHDLPVGVDGLIDRWWDSLAESEQQLALLLAVAGASLPLELLQQMSKIDVSAITAFWEACGLINLTVQRAAGDGELSLIMAAYSHGAIAKRLMVHSPQGVTAAHRQMAAAQAYATRAGSKPAELYLLRNYGRHLAGDNVVGQEHEHPGTELISRERLRIRERQDGVVAAYHDSAYALVYAGKYGSALQLAIAAAQTGTLATLARSLSADAAVAALLAGMERGGRENALRQVLDLVERLPDGSDKAQILRRLGETCYAHRMRSSAMRLLSRAIDLEAQPISRAWRDQREQLLAALALAALGCDDSDSALAIAEQIEHLERRAQVETQVARRLLAQGDRDRAQRVPGDSARKYGPMGAG